MKTQVKLFVFAITVILIASMVGCAPKTTPTPTTAPATPPPATSTPEPVTLRYANWNVGTAEENNIQRQLITAYTTAHPWVTIEFVDMSGDGSWDQKLTNLAAQGTLPDVWMVDHGPYYVAQGWTADLTALTAADPDWQNVSSLVRGYLTLNGQVFALPAAQFIQGYWVDKDMYEAANLDAPTYGMSVEDFFTVANALNNPDQGVLGLDEQEFIMGWYAHAVDPTLGWMSYDGTKVNLNSDAFKQAIAKALESKTLTWQGLTDEQKTKFKSVGPWEIFAKQEAGVRWDGAWNAPGWVTSLTFDWDFVGIPGGSQGLVLDLLAVSKTASNLNEAYQFAKWMTFSKEAYATEVQLATAAGQYPKFPVSMDADSVALYKTIVDKPGINSAIANLDNSITESLVKFVPGYGDVRWDGKPGINVGTDQDVNMWYMFNAAITGTIKYEDYSAQLDTFANGLLTTAQAQLQGQ